MHLPTEVNTIQDFTQSHTVIPSTLLLTARRNCSTTIYKTCLGTRVTWLTVHNQYYLQTCILISWLDRSKKKSYPQYAAWRNINPHVGFLRITSSNTYNSTRCLGAVHSHVGNDCFYFKLSTIGSNQPTLIYLTFCSLHNLLPLYAHK